MAGMGFGDRWDPVLVQQWKELFLAHLFPTMISRVTHAPSIE
jgi:hypothetical protein